MKHRQITRRAAIYASVAFGCVLLISAGVVTNVRAAKGGAARPQSAPTSFSGSNTQSGSHSSAQDPGPRATIGTEGAPLLTLGTYELEYFQDGLDRFLEVDSVSGNAAGEQGKGLGPTFNSNSCTSCHSQPAAGGSSPATNPLFAIATDAGASNTMPSFMTIDGPVREVRFPFLVNSTGTVSKTPDGGVHTLFTISGRSDAPGCRLQQPNFAQMQQANNIAFRIPTPIFGAGLIENISDATIYANMNANSFLKQHLGISGHVNTSGNDGTVTRFGWKAQNKSLLMFSGEAYNVEMGVTNELFPEERARPPAGCLTNPTPEDTTNFPASGAASSSDLVAFANFMRFLAPPAPSSQGIPGNPSAKSIANGKAVFSQIHCDGCHTPAMKTASSNFSPGLSNQIAALYSDLLVHHMGTGLADNISQGSAGPDEFRTAPLWGLGQRLFFLHDGRATPASGGLVTAIQDHASNGSEANAVIGLYHQLSDQQKQDLLNFLRSL
jgi:CxxC motif-containing protein (DUF1111 family)